jgi:hypothetical protein
MEKGMQERICGGGVEIRSQEPALSALRTAQRSTASESGTVASFLWPKENPFRLLHSPPAHFWQAEVLKSLPSHPKPTSIASHTMLKPGTPSQKRVAKVKEATVGMKHVRPNQDRSCGLFL